MKVLIAEDDAVSRTILRRAVEKTGHECLAAADGEEAWAYPTEEEWFEYVVRRDVDEIVSTLDPDDVPWIEEERKIAER